MKKRRERGRRSWNERVHGCVRGYMQPASVERLGIEGAKASRRHPRRPP